MLQIRTFYHLYKPWNFCHATVNDNDAYYTPKGATDRMYNVLNNKLSCLFLKACKDMEALNYVFWDAVLKSWC